VDKYNDVKKSIQSKSAKINNIVYSCITPKILKCYRIRKLLEKLKSDIIFLEKYNIYMLNNCYYLPEAEILLSDTKQLYDKYFKMCSIPYSAKVKTPP
jgi:hypothetical protein